MKGLKGQLAVAYYRVSTVRQGRSGLGLEAQQASVVSFAQKNELTLAAEYTEIESGKRDNRPKLLQAIEFGRKNEAILLIAKLDRLSRNATFTLALRDSGVNFIAVDTPDVNALTIGILALVAQDERERIATRIREALQAKKARGFSLGKPENLTQAAQRKGALAQKLRAQEHYRLIVGYVKHLRKQQYSLQAIAKTLNHEGHQTVKGAQFTPMHIKRILQRVDFIS